MAESLDPNVWSLIFEHYKDADHETARHARVNRHWRRMVGKHFAQHGKLCVLGRRVDAHRLARWPTLAVIRTLHMDMLVLGRPVVLTRCELKEVDLRCITYAPVPLTLPAHGALKGTIACIAGGSVRVIWADHEHRRHIWSKCAGYLPERQSLQEGDEKRRSFSKTQ